MKTLSIVIICWNDREVIGNCLHSIYAGTHSREFEIIVSDNGSTDGSVEFIRQKYPAVRVCENSVNLGFSKGNNVGIRGSRGELILILNPDTLVHDGMLDKWVRFADQRPEVGGFGCRVLNPDGSYQISARPFPTVWRHWIAAMYLRPLAYLSDIFVSDTYVNWKGDTERWIDWQSGCCLMLRADLVKRLGGFDEQFFFSYEEVDLCHRIWEAGYPIVYTPDVTITHLGGQSSSRRFPMAFELENYRNRYRYFYKHYGSGGARRCRRVALVHLRFRQLGYGLLQLLNPSGGRRNQLEVYQTVINWNKAIDPVRLVEKAEEPDFGVKQPSQLP